MTPFPGPGRGPHPTEVPGYERARRLGLLPAVPPDPPAPVVPNSNHARLWFLGALLAYMAVTLPLGDAFGWGGLTSLLVIGLGVMALILGAILVPSRLMFREFAAGYCRSDAIVGVYVIDRRVALQNRAGPAGAEWDLRGLWRLDSHDRPVRAPVPDVLPVGRYPSPHKPGKLEYWTGRDWHYMYAEPPVPFLDGTHA